MDQDDPAGRPPATGAPPPAKHQPEPPPKPAIPPSPRKRAEGPGVLKHRQEWFRRRHKPS